MDTNPHSLSPGDPIIDAVLHDLQSSHAEGRAHTLAECAQALQMGPRTLERRLHRAGTTFRQLRNESIVQLAKAELRGSKSRIADISAGLGFRENASFTRAFRRATGMTPSQFRRTDRIETATRM